VLFYIEGEDHEQIILINTAKDRIKQKNVSKDPRVSISIVDEDNPYSMITVNIVDADKYPAHSPDVKRIILKIKPEKIFYIPPRYTEYLQKNK
jgi:hypothetical protein